uniref:Uncharacterized protein n=1 Tax=Meloidogyne enterolobii TaxID=390850 RepID=A0A6V7VUP5_MELEN|nr:unnamed protein product [Meloidogyne enterolobii]
MVISLTCDCWWTLGSLFNLNTRECKRNFRHYFNNSDMDSDEPTLLLVQMKKPLKRHRNGSVFVNKLVLNENLEELTLNRYLMVVTIYILWRAQILYFK